MLTFGVSCATLHAINGWYRFVRLGPDADPVLVFGLPLINIVIYLLLVARAGYRLIQDKPDSRFGLKLALGILSLWGLFYLWIGLRLGELSIFVQGLFILMFVSVIDTALVRSANDAAGGGNHRWMGATGPTIAGGIVGYTIFQVMVPSPRYAFPREQGSRAVTAAFAGALGVAAAHAVVWVWRKLWDTYCREADTG